MAVNRVRAVLLTNKDDVAAVLVAAGPQASIDVTLSASGEKVLEVSALQSIPFGHKIAIRDIATGEAINRYGFPIGVATADIKQGGHVHVHNMRSLLSPVRTEGVRPGPLRSNEWLTQVVSDTLRAAGARAEAAATMAESITEAHLRGVDTHGLRRLRPYIARIRAGGVDGMAEPEIAARNAVLMVDGRNGVGHYIAAVAAQAVSTAARRFGVAIALVRNSNHFGFAGYFATMIAAHGQIGIVTSKSGQVCRS
jgi:hypothetical protein